MTDILLENRGLTFLPQYSLQFTRTGIDFSGSDLEKLSFEEWSDTAERLMFIEAGIQWTVGDWFNMGERLYGEMYSQVMDALGLSFRTITTYQYVCAKIPFSRRREQVSFTHHKEVASLVAELQKLSPTLTSGPVTVEAEPTLEDTQEGYSAPQTAQELAKVDERPPRRWWEVWK